MFRQLRRAFGSIKDQIVPTFAKSTPQPRLTEALYASVAPITAGALMCFVMPPQNLWVEHLPMLFEGTLVYANLHACVMAGTHWGMAGAQHEHSDTPEQQAATRRHFRAAAIIPTLLSTSLATTLFIEPTVTLYLTTIGITALGYAGVSFGDKVLVGSGRAPEWLFPFRLGPHMLAIFSVCLLTIPVTFNKDMVIAQKPDSSTSDLKSIEQLSKET